MNKILVISICVTSVIIGVAIGVGVGVGLKLNQQQTADYVPENITLPDIQSNAISNNLVKPSAPQSPPPQSPPPSQPPLPPPSSPLALRLNKILYVKDLVENWDMSKEWNIIKTTYGHELCTSTSNNTMQVLYPMGSYIPSAPIQGGFQFYAQPSLFPSTEIRAKYRIKFPNNFNFVKGGKLPGLWIGIKGASGGNHIEDGASFRVMWRENGYAEAYVYTPFNQSRAFYASPGYVNNGEYGDSLWRKEFMFKRGVWNTVELYMLLNDNYQSNGIISLTINNINRRFSGMKWMESNTLISGLMMHSFFGGSDETWSSPTNQVIEFGDVFIEK